MTPAGKEEKKKTEKKKKKGFFFMKHNSSLVCLIGVAYVYIDPVFALRKMELNPKL